MMLRKWDDLPDDMKNPAVRRYYDMLCERKGSLFWKRVFDIAVASVLLIVLAIPMLFIVLLIIADTPGGVFFRQTRVTTGEKRFRIYKFRTMIANAEYLGARVTVDHDPRVTKIGAFLRKYRLDELPQLFNVLSGDMSFVGTRPEVPKYVDAYTDEMKATLLLPAGITSEASIRYKDEARLLNQSGDVDQTYIERVLPEKMKFNLAAIEKYSFGSDLATMARTVLAVLGKEYSEEIRIA